MKTAIPTDTFAALKALIVESLIVDPDDIQQGARLEDDLGADPVEVADLFVAVEREWGIEISQETTARLRSVQDIIDHIEECTE